MAYRKFKADYLFTGSEMLDNNQVLITDREGSVQDIVGAEEAGGDIQMLDGLLSPGFINSHCHLELSHLKGLIPEKKGLVDFVFSIVSQRLRPEEEISDAIAKAEDEMIANGIIGVGDICNNLDTYDQKQKNRLLYYNFIEASGWHPSVAQARFNRSKEFLDSFQREEADGHPRLSMTPHAPYSVSEELWELIMPWFANKTATIHNQESKGEDQFFESGKGDLLRMYQMMQIQNDFFRPTNKSSLQSYFSKMKQAKNIILVHNTFTREEDIQYAIQTMNNNRKTDSLYFCICANANLYIENTIPPVELLLNHKCNIVLGTDSLASNHQLDILAEMKTIARHFHSIPLAELLKWATLNGAKAIEMDDVAGSFSKGKKPGVLLIKNLDDLHLNEKVFVQRIL